MNITYLSAVAATLTNGNKSITVTGEHVDFSKADDYLAVVDNGLYVLRVESGTAPDINGDSTLILVDAWSGATLSNKDLFVFPTFAKIYESVAAMSALNDVTRGILTKLKDLLTATTPTIDIAVGQTTSITTVPYQYLIDQLQTAIANNAQLISDEVTASLAKIRYSKLDNPLCHLFKKNKLVDTLQGELTWSRATTATYIDRYGVLKTAAIDEPRQEAEGWLIEGTSTNLILWSEDIANVSWTKGSNVAVTSDFDVAPDGSTTTDLITLSLEDGHQIVQIFQQEDSKEYTFSIWLKSSQYSSVNFQLAYYDGGAFKDGVNVNLTAEFQRFEFTFTTVIGNVSPQIRLNGFSNGSDGDSFEIWGAQLEKLPFASSYIPTTNSAATRASDRLSIPFYGNMLTPVSNFSISTCFSVLGWVNYNNIFATSNNFADGKIQAFAHPAQTVATNIGGVSDAVSSPSISLQGESQRYTLVGDGEFYNAYSDDKVGMAKAIVNPVIGSDTHLILGASSMSGSGHLFGHLNDFRTYDFALNSDEVSFLAGE
ncbi:phage head spike fiber domain-containing protein [Colwellia psychrerythraea]|uniref:Uncharacterized protein n=1 Tax=Colwellia psychrerythraea TaxID=28229 RepID=A0A099KFL5_COLPS|nr:hypothetical protein [Colwellia psychrerythraea]KGJ88802.1 hypothetical protein ND2E_0095 [Colwellia psychrerythraea]